MVQLDRSQLLRRLLVTFRGELAEHALELERAFLGLEQAPVERRSDSLKILLRIAHSLKGAARSVDLEPIEKTCHLLEEVLARLTSSTLELSSDLVALFFSVSDSLKGAATILAQPLALDANTSELESPRALEEGLRSVLAQLEEWSKAEVQAPATTPDRQAQDIGVPASDIATAQNVVPDDGTTVRLTGEKIDRLLAQSTELLSALWRVESQMPHLAATTALTQETDSRRLLGHWRQLEQAAKALHAGVQSLRLVPFATACQGLPRMVRDLAKQSHKQVRLTIRGGDLEVDKSLLDSLGNLLRHLVRNAIDHGIETAAERRNSGKAEEGRLIIDATLTRQRVEISVEDNGRGIDLAALRRVFLQRYGTAPTSEGELLVSIFQPGLSTAAAVTKISGRGMGLDIVKSQLSAIQGTVEVAHTPGEGARFTLSVPLTLSTMPAITLEAAGQLFLVPSASIERLVKIAPEQIKVLDGRAYVDVGSKTYTVARLGDLLSIGKAKKSPKRASGHARYGVLLRAGHSSGVILVDELVAERSIVVKNLGARLRKLPGIAGATILPNGHLALVLNIVELLGHMAAADRNFDFTQLKQGAAKAKKRILIAEDSVTVRALEKSLLEGFGFEVHAAPDGEAAWRLLQHKGADLLLTDIEMPGMDGFTLIKTIRASKKYTHLPVILLTSQESERDKRLGIEAGADAYLVKRSFDQTSLLATINQLI